MVSVRDSLRNRTRQIGRFFLGNGQDIPLSPVAFYDQCNEMCADSSNKNERSRGGEVIACVAKECSIAEPKNEREQAMVAKAIGYHASLNWMNLSSDKHCCDNMSCSDKKTPCNAVDQWNHAKRCITSKIDSCPV